MGLSSFARGTFRTARLLLVFSAVLILALVAAACADDDADEVDDTTDEAEEPDAAEEDEVDDDPAEEEAEEEAADEPDDGETYELVLGATSASGSLEVEALERWADAVGDETDGAVDISILPDGQLGSELETQEAIITGDVQGVSGGITGIEEWDFLATAYVFRDAEHMMDVMRSDVTDPWEQAWIDEAGIEVVGYLERLPRTLTSNTPVETPEDTEGLDVRVPETDFQIDIWRAVGANPTAVPAHEVYSALEAGVVDAQENALDTAYATGVAEVQDYVILTAHTYMPQLVGVDTEFMNSLPDDLEATVREEMTQAEDWLSEQLEAEFDNILESMQDEGVEVIEPDVEAFREAMFPVTEEYAEDIWGLDLLDRMMNDF